MGCTGNVCKGSHMMQWDVNEDNYMKYITNLRTDAEKFLKNFYSSNDRFDFSLCGMFLWVPLKFELNFLKK